jgi:peptidoglycan biosynthesis protein MviN/MurJ (putative lipid II flippase)
MSGLLQLGLGLAAAAALSVPFGLYGIAAGLALGEAIALGVVLPLLARRASQDDVGYVRYLLICIRMFAAAAIWSAAVAWGALWLISSPTIFGFIGAGAIWGAIGFLPALYVSASKRYRANIRKNLL